MATPKLRYPSKSAARKPAGRAAKPNGAAKKPAAKKHTDGLTAAQREAIENLKGFGIKRGSVLYTVIRSAAPSGMSRVIDVIYFTGRKANGEVDQRILSYNVATVLGRKLKGHEGIITPGAGMDMGFETVHSLSQMMFGDGYALKQKWL